MATRATPTLWRDTMKAGARRSGALFAGTLLFLLTIAAVLALVSYHADDPSLNTASGAVPRNLLGGPGAWFADMLYALLGVPALLLAPVGLIIAARLWGDRPVGDWGRMLRGVLIGMLLLGTGLAFWPWWQTSFAGGLGGVIGLGVASGIRWGLSFVGEPVAELWIGRGIALLLVLIGGFLSFRALGLALQPSRWRLPRIERAPAPEITEEPLLREPTGPRPPRKVAVPENRPGPVIADRSVAPSQAKPKPAQNTLDFKDTYNNLPPLDLLKAPPVNKNASIDKAALERNARLLESVLDDFHVKGQIVEVRPGPVVTMYELEPASGIKASRVIQLADDIARNMSAISARVATIPGRSVIGIELPNAKREAVSLHELIGSQTFEDQGASLPIVLGKNIAGDPVIADLAPMPHLLVAGTTGSGKSVGLNCMILSLLYRLTPDQCRMIMIDPKMLELSMYKGIPHLLADVVTEPPKAVRALKWAVEQMEERYRMMASVNVRSLASFNDKVRQARQKGQKLGRKVQCGYDENGRPMYEEETLDLAPLPG